MSNDVKIEPDATILNNSNLVEADIKVISDKTTTCQIVQFLAYVRHAIRHNLQAEIKVKVGSKIADGQLLFDVNGLEIPDLITQDTLEIN